MNEMKHTFVVDASYDHGRGVTGIGVAIHATDQPGRNGVLIDQVAEAYGGLRDGRGEWLAVYRALEIALERQYRRVRVRSDYAFMRRSLKRDAEEGSGAHRGDLHGAILRMVQHFESVQFGCKARRKNQMAHSLARRAAKELPPIWREDLAQMCECSMTQANQASHVLRNPRRARLIAEWWLTLFLRECNEMAGHIGPCTSFVRAHWLWRMW